MGNWKYAIIIISGCISFFLLNAGCPDGQCATARNLEKSLRRKGYSEQEIEERLNQVEVKARMKQAKYGLEYEEATPQWPEDPRYPVPYLFYREGQVDFGFNRW